MIRRQRTCRALNGAIPAIVWLMAAFVAVGVSRAQTAATLSQVRKLYVEPFHGKRGATEIRSEVVARLKHDPGMTLVASASQSDAVLKGTGEIWTTGYISTNPRAASSSRSPVYSGYLSLTLEGSDGQPLWSYLVTPGGSLSGSITANLAGHAAKLLLSAVAHERAAGKGVVPAPDAGASAAPAGETLKGAGGTFPAPLYQAWIGSFRQVHPDIRIAYEPIGSEAGIQDLLDGKVDFAGSDMPASRVNVPLQRFATVLGAVVPIYNLRGLDHPLHFTPQVLAGIYLGKITRWNDPAVRAANRGLSLPDAPIAVVHRSDGSGTTYVFTDFLAKTSQEWRSAVGTGSSVPWPVGSGAAGNSGVAEQVLSTPNSIGYVELTYAIQQELSFGAVRNSAGAFIAASLESVAAAAQSASMAPGGAPSIVDAPGKNAYPIASFTWIVLPERLTAGNRKVIAEMLQWMLTSGQKQSSALGYAPLPHDLASRELLALGQLK